MGRRLLLVATALLLTAGVAAGQNARQQQAMQLRQAESLERAGELDRALGILDGVLSESPAEPRAILAVERIHRRQRRGVRTLPIVRRAMQADPSSATLHQVELRVLADLGRTAELKQAGEMWLIAVPTSELAYREYAEVLRRIGAYGDAESVLKRGREAIERPSALSSELADIYLERGRFDEAAAEWARIVRSSPGLGWDLITFKLERLGPSARPAAEAIIATLSSEERTETGRMLIAVAALYADQPDVARGEAGAVVENMVPAERQEFTTYLARVASRRSKPAMVAWAYRLLLPYVAEDSLRWNLARQIVQHDLSAGDTATAIDILESVLDRSEAGSRSHQWASGWQIRLYAARPEPTRAERSFQNHLRWYPDDSALPSLALTVAESNIRKGRLEQADRVLSSVPLDAANPRLSARMAAARGYLALYAARYEEALSEFEKAAVSLLGEERSDALRFLGFLRDANPAELETVAAAHRASLQDRPDRAFEKLIDGLRRAPASSARPGLLLLAGELAIDAGSIDRAETVLRRIVERHSESGEAPVALMILADALVRDRRQAEAIALLEELILDYPESALTPIARRRLAELRQQVPRS